MKSLKVTMVLIFLLILSTASPAQNFQRITHVGMETSFGLHGFSILNDNLNSRALTRGGSIGFVAGNKVLLSRIRLAGIYQSTGFTSLAFNLMESEALINIYPLEFFRTRKNILDIYVTTGIKFNKFRLDDENTYSDIARYPDLKNADRNEPQYILSQVTGIGIEFLLPGQAKFVNVFAEALFSNPVITSSNFSDFYDTWRDGETCVNIGLRFGSVFRKNSINQ